MRCSESAQTFSPSVIKDWGDFDNDYRDQTHDESNGVAQNRDEDGAGFATTEEVQTYYDNCLAEDITILRESDE